MKIGFIILHYKTFSDTTECVESLKKINRIEQSVIYIVDNCSNNGSEEKLEKKYSFENNIKIIKSDKNLGFAKGNNLGIKAALRDKCDFLICLNNDTLIKQANFIDEVVTAWKRTQYSIGGPRIISTIDGLDQNPFIVPRHFIKSIKMALKLYLLGLIKYSFVKLHLPQFWDKGSNKNKFNGGLYNQELNSDTTDFLLYGACIILSPTYLRKYNKLCGMTFMYEEETIIYLLSRLLNYKVEYIPDAIVYHKEQSSTKDAFGTGRKKELFGYREDFKSRYQVLKLMLHANNKQYLQKKLRD